MEKRVSSHEKRKETLEDGMETEEKERDNQQ